MGSNAPVRVRRVLDNQNGDYKAAVIAMTDAFDDDLHQSLLDESRASVEHFIRAHLKAAIIGGELVVADLPDVGIIGAATWFGPDRRFLLTEEQQDAGYNQLMSSLSPIKQAWWDGRYIKLSDHAFGADIKLSSYFLQILGVAPRYQRRGVARALIKCGENMAKKAGAVAALETAGEVNVNVYRSLGYEVAGTHSLISSSGQVVDFVVMIKAS